MFFLFVIKFSWREVRWNSINDLFSLEFHFIHLFQYKLVVPYFIQWDIICYYHLFWWSKYVQRVRGALSNWLLYFLICPHNSLSTSLHFTATKMFQAHLVFLRTQPWNQAHVQGALILVMKNGTSIWVVGVQSVLLGCHCLLKALSQPPLVMSV